MLYSSFASNAKHEPLSRGQTAMLMQPDPCEAETKSMPKLIGEGVKFQRVRRITGYLVGTMERWNDAKLAEERDRVKHV
jgi:hypothetical protein